MRKKNFTRVSSTLILSLLGGALLTLSGCGGGGAGGGGSSTPFSSTSSTATTKTQAVLAYGVSGTRGYLPVTIAQGTGGVVAYKALDSTGSLTLDTSSNTTVQVDAPAAYADRSFVKWQRGGQDLSSAASMSFTPATLPGSGALTAVYQAQAPSGGAFAPNFSRSGFPSWDHFPVRVYLDSTATADATKAASITHGMDRWAAASGGLIAYTLVTDPSQADITITFGGTPTGLAALTNAAWDGNNHLTSATITLNPADGTTAKSSVVQDLDTIVAHEYGHSLGLIAENDATAGHSTDPNDTMYPTGNTQIGLISARDINTVASNYLSLFNGTRSVSAGLTKLSTTPAGPATHHATIE